MDTRALERLLHDHAEELADAALVEVTASDGGLDASTTGNLRLGIETAIALFCERLRDADREVDTELFEHHGRLQFDAGRSLEEMLRFYMRGGQAVRRATEQLADLTGADPADTLRLGDELMGFLGDLLQAATIGYSTEAADLARRRQEALDELWAALSADPPQAPHTVSAAAEAAGWPLPERVRGVLGRRTSDPGATPARRRLPGNVLCASLGGGVVALLAADGPDGEEAALRAARAIDLADPLVIGLPVAPAHAARTITAAAALLGTSAPSQTPVRCEERLPETLLALAPEIAAAIAVRRLAALERLPPSRRRRLLETLEAWLDHPGQPQAIANRLGLHVQTVRYRLGRLRDTLGESIDDPQARFELALALRARAVLAAER